MVELFKTKQSHMEASILQLAAGETVRSMGPSRKRKEERIQKIEDKFEFESSELVRIVVQHLYPGLRWIG